MRFVDAGVFVHGMINPTRTLTEKEVKLKETAAKIVDRINNGEKIGFTTAQISEYPTYLKLIHPIKLPW